MNNFIFENATKVYFGQGCVREYLPCLTKQYGNTIMLAYGGGSIKRHGIYDEVMSILTDAGSTVIEFPGIPSNPTYAKVLEGARLAREAGVDLILGAGGGSVMDCCKAISLAARYDGDAWADFWARPGVFTFDPVPLGVIVTVSGTGSEMNGGAVITHEALRVKTGRDYPRCNPRFALMDPTYTYSVPRFQMASGAFDTLSHIMEIYFSAPDEDNVSDDIAEALMRSTIRSLRAALRNPQDYTARSNLMWNAAMAENRIIKLGKRTDFECHQMEHQLGAYTNCNHGAGLAVLQPEYYRHIYRDGLSKFHRFAVNVWGIDPTGKPAEEVALAGIDALANFIPEIGLPSTLQELGVDEQTDLKAIAYSCSLAPGGYRRMTHEEILAILQACMGSGTVTKGRMHHGSTICRLPHAILAGRKD